MKVITILYYTLRLLYIGIRWTPRTVRRNLKSTLKRNYADATYKYNLTNKHKENQ